MTSRHDNGELGPLERLVKNALARITRHIQTELREAGLVNEPSTRLPPPHDAALEVEVCAALLRGYLRAADFAPLEARDFSIRLCAFVYSLYDASDAFAPHGVALALAKNAGIPRGDATTLIASLTTGALSIDLPERAAKLIELGRRRRLLDAMAELDARVRLGAVTPGELHLALERLRELAEGRA